MKIKISEYDQFYHQFKKSGDVKFHDKWHEGVYILPFSTNASKSAYDKKCSLQGCVGEFFRLCINDGSKAIDDFEESAIKPIRAFLKDKKSMSESKINEFVNILRDVMYVNGNLNITDSSFLKYLPLMPVDDSLLPQDLEKYRNGQKKVADYLFSMLGGESICIEDNVQKNLFTSLIQQALNDNGLSINSQKTSTYTILPFIKKSFKDDLIWMLGQEDSVKVKYFHLFFHFYLCYSVTQTLYYLSPEWNKEISGPEKFYFILATERASLNHDAVTRGWQNKISPYNIGKTFGRTQALDIANSILDKNVGFYPEVLNKLNETPFQDNKHDCETLLQRYKDEKSSLISSRDSEPEIPEDVKNITISIESYQAFLKKLEDLCVGLQSVSYVNRMRKKIIDLMSIRFLQNRRGNYVLTLDNEMLTFLIALFTRGEKVKLEEMYKRFNAYGIYFNRETRLRIEEYLLKLNLLDRKSDSGEAQYVRVVL